MYASHSKLECAESCPARYKYRYIDKRMEKRSMPLIIGGAAHDVFARYAEHCLAQGVATDVEAVPGIVREVVYGDSDSAGGSQIQAEVAEIAERFAESHIFDASSIVGVEERLPSTWNPPDSWPSGPNLGGKHVFLGIVDLLEADGSKAIITDYKTDWQVRAQGDVERDPQLRRYCWLISQEYPQFEEFEVRLDFVRHSIVRTVEFGLDVVKETEADLLAMVDRLAATREFPATPGQACAICGYTDACPALKGRLGDTTCANMDKATEIAEQILVHEKYVAELKESLKAWCGANGPVAVNGVEWAHTKCNSSGVSEVRALADALTAKGVDVWQYLNVDANSLKALLKKDPTKSLAQPFVVDKSYTMFKSRRIREEEEAAG